MTDPKKAPTATGAKKGKVKGTATTTPKAADQEAQDVQGSPVPDTDAARDQVPDGIDKEAYQAGYDASKRGTPSLPPLTYSDDEVKAWYRGYKSHANPQNGGPVADIEGGYRGNY